MATFTYVGKPLPRLEGAEKVTGKRLYTADVQLPRMLHARILRSPFAHARIRGIDVARARAYPGVAAALTGADIPDLPADTGTRYLATLAVDEVIFYGQPVAAVLADEASIAEEALELIQVDYEPLPAVINPVEAVKEAAPVVRTRLGATDRSEEQIHHAETIVEGEADARPGSNVSQKVVYQRGDMEQGFAEADVVMEHTWHASMVHQGYIEAQGAIADCDANGDFTIWTSTQGLFRQREEVARVLGIPETRITFESVEMGGGFGGKNMAFTAALAAVLARAVRRPVKYILSRSEDMKAANPSPQVVTTIKSGVTKDGRITAIKAQVILDCGAFPGGPIASVCNSVGGFYDVPNYDIVGLEVMTNKVSVGALRAPGQPSGAFAIESQMDLMARAVGMDPLSFRIKNAAKDDTAPPAGRRWGPMYYKELLERVQQTDLWKSRDKLGVNQGVGVAGGGRLSGANRGNAMVTINRDGTASVLVGQQDITGINTAYAQIAAEELGISPDQVKVYGGSTRSAPYAGSSAGSTSLRSTGRAVQEAAVDARNQLFRHAANALECNPGDLEMADGQVRVKGSPDKALAIQALTALTAGQGTPHPSIIGHGNVGPGARVPAWTAAAVKVEVDPDTGLVTILDAVCVEDVGQAINPVLVEGQIQGGLAQALGLGALEEMQWGDDGVLRNPTLLDYRMATALDLPPLQAELMEYPGVDELYGAKGVGEPSIIAGAAALANAIDDATGARVYEIPATAERVLKALGKV